MHTQSRQCICRRLRHSSSMSTDKKPARQALHCSGHPAGTGSSKTSACLAYRTEPGCQQGSIICHIASGTIAEESSAGPSPQTWADALQRGVDAMRKYGGAKAGDRTMLDALLPAALSLTEALQSGQPMHDTQLLCVGHSTCHTALLCCAHAATVYGETGLVQHCASA